MSSDDGVPMEDVVDALSGGNAVDAEVSPSPSVVEVGADGLPVDVSESPRATEGEDVTETISTDPVDKFAEPGRTRRFATIMNMVNSLIGAGILGVPMSMMRCGVVLSVMILVVIGVLSHISTVQTMRLQVLLDAAGLDNVAMKVLGRWGSLAVSLFLLLFLVSTMIAYLVIGSDCLMSWLRLADFDVSGFWPRCALVVIYAVALPVLLTIPRELKFLSYFSFLTVVSIAFYFVAMIIKAGMIFPKEGVAPIVLAKVDMGMFSALSVYALAFALPTVVLPIIGPYNKDLKKRNLVSMITIIGGFIFMAVPGVIGYLLYGENTADNVLLSFPDNDGLIVAVRVGFFLVVTFSYPALCHSVAGTWGMLIYKENDHRRLDNKKRSLVLFMSNILPIVMAMLLPSAGPALAIGGAVGGCMIDFFFPPLMTIKMSKKPISAPKNIASVVFAVFGVVVCIICTYQAIVDAVAAFS